MKKVYMAVHELKENKGGMTTAIFNRSKHLYDVDIPADIITFDYDINYELVIKNLKDSNKMDQRTQMINLFEYYDNITTKKSITKKKLSKFYFSLLKKHTPISENQNITRYFSAKDGSYKFYVKTDTTKNIIFIDEFENGKRVKRIHFKKQIVKYIMTFNHENKLISETFFNANGHPFINRSINPLTKSIGNTFLFFDNLQFKNNLEFSVHFLNTIIEDSNDISIICDGPGSFPKILATKHKLTKKFSVIHANHFENYTTNNSKKKHEDFILKNADAITGIIVLTNRQKEDILKDYPITNIHVISNFIDIGSLPSPSKTDKIIGHVSRLNKQKGFDRLIKVASKVVAKDNDVKFHIYGSGGYEQEIQALIKNYNLTDNFILKGYTNEFKKVITNMRCIVSTSYFEGQGLSLIEAMEQQKTIVSFDIRYGPSDFIKNNINGFLVPDGNLDIMAEKLLFLMDNPEIATEFGINARETVIDLYSSENILKQWVTLF